MYRCQKDGQEYALKVFSRHTAALPAHAENWMQNSACARLLAREAQLMRKLDHPNILKLVAVIDEPKEENFALVLELSPDQQILQWDDYMRIFFVDEKYSLTEQFLRQAFRGVVDGLLYLHGQQLAHCDLKPSNILFFGENAKLADFGSCCYLDSKPVYEGTTEFMPPESFSLPKRKMDLRKVDVWELGCCLYCYAYRKLPFDAPEMEPLEQLIFYGVLKLSDEVCSSALNELIRFCLAKNPAKRISLGEVRNHPWFAGE